MIGARFLCGPLLLSLAACSSMSGTGDPAVHTLAERPAQTAADASAAPASAVASSVPNTTAEYTGSIRRESEFVSQNRRLFSKAEDERPTPAEGSPEWEHEQARDAQRERDLRRAIQICRC